MRIRRRVSYLWPIGRGAKRLWWLRRQNYQSADRRTRAQQWADAIQTLADLLDHFQKWRDNLPASLESSPTAEALDAVLELRGYVEELQAVTLPKGFRRD